MAKSTDERCKRPAVGEHGKCGFHGGKTPTQDENPNVGAEVGNQHAKGNPGGSPPDGNMNALKTGAHADPVNLFEWLLEEDREAAVWILNKLHGYSKRAPEAVYVADVDAQRVDSYEDVTVNLTAYGDDVLMMCVRDYARWKATKRQLQEGIISEQEQLTDQGVWTTEDSNPVNLDLDRMDGTTIQQKDKLGLLPSSGSGGSGEMPTVVEVLKDPGQSLEDVDVAESWEEDLRGDGGDD